jgi:hypothetical protein
VPHPIAQKKPSQLQFCPHILLLALMVEAVDLRESRLRDLEEARPQDSGEPQLRDQGLALRRPQVKVF